MRMAWGTTTEEMLRWQIDRTRKWLEESRKGIAESEELFKLPQRKGEPSAGTPEDWAFGKLTLQEVSLRSAARSFRFAAGLLDDAEKALSDGDLATTINLVVQARDHVWSTTTSWYSSHSTKMWRYVEKSRQSYRRRGGMRKKTIRIDGEDDLSGLTQLTNVLAPRKDYLGDYLPANELWNVLIGLMDAYHLEPKEISGPEQAISYLRNDYGDRKILKFETFKSMLSTARSELSKHS